MYVNNMPKIIPTIFKVLKRLAPLTLNDPHNKDRRVFETAESSFSATMYPGATMSPFPLFISTKILQDFL